MSIQKRFLSLGCRLPLWLALALLCVAFGSQRWLAHYYAHAESEAYGQYIDQIVHQSETLRQERLDKGTLWLGQLHDENVAPNDPIAPSPSSMTLEGQRRISIESIPLGKGSRYHLAMEIHECNPGSEACSSGGTIRLSTASGEPLFTCELGMLLAGAAKQSYYSLLWDEAAESMTVDERQQLLNELAGDKGLPVAATFLENLQVAYRYDNHQDGAGKEQAQQLWQNVFQAIIADRS
jgi:hypothetical protein